MISYDPLWATLEKKQINMTQMRELSGIATATMAKLRKNKSITLVVINKICCALDCNIEDVVRIESTEPMYYI